MKLLVLALVAVGLIFGAKCMAVRQDLVSERLAIDADWAQVEIALQHRAAIVPALTGLLQAEAQPAVAAVVQALTDASNTLAAAHGRQEKIQANTRLDDAFSRLMLQVENYPKIENGKPYADLLETLKGAEYEIAVARRKYNEAVEHYNARLDLFPNNIVASLTAINKIDAYFRTPAI